MKPDKIKAPLIKKDGCFSPLHREKLSNDINIFTIYYLYSSSILFMASFKWDFKFSCASLFSNDFIKRKL